MDSTWVDLGTIVTVHGLDGEVVVKITGDDPEGLGRYETMQWLPPDGPEKSLDLESLRVHRGMPLLKFQGVTGRDEALELVGGRLRVPRSELAPLEDGKFYVVDLIGLSVVTTDGRVIGKVREVLETGANDVYVLDHEGREVLIPAVDNVVKSIDLNAGKIVIEVLEGLLD